MNLYAGLFEAGSTASFSPDPDRKIWLQVALGSIELADIALNAGDGVAMETVQPIVLKATEQAEVLLFDMGDDARSINYRVM